MQYLLTEFEFNNLVSKDVLYLREISLNIARVKLLTLTGTTCIHASTSQMEYCDYCPCVITNAEKEQHGIFSSTVDICRLEKNWST